MVINTNQAATRSARLLGDSTSRLAKSLARLSSGSKIVSPEDDAAGLAQSIKLSSESRRHRAAMSNLQNAVSLSQTQDGYLQKVQKALDRMSEISVLAQDITKTDDDRANYDVEFQAIKRFIDKSFEAEFNGVGLFSAGQTVTTVVPSQNGLGQSSLIVATGGTSGTLQLNWDFFGQADQISVYYPPQGQGGAQLFDSGSVLGQGSTNIAFGPGASQSIEIIMNEGGGGTTWQFDATVTAESGGIRNVTTDGEGSQFGLTTITPISVSGSVDTLSTASTALTSLKSAIQTLANRRTSVGANLTRLNAHYDELAILSENLDAANSRIVDTDVAEESTRYARNNILVQSGTAMLAQANILPQSALRLLG